MELWVISSRLSLVLSNGSELDNKPRLKHQASCQTCDVRAWVIRCRLTLARTLSLCWVRAIALVGPAAWDWERLVAGRAVEGRLSVSLRSWAESPESRRFNCQICEKMQRSTNNYTKVHTKVYTYLLLLDFFPYFCWKWTAYIKYNYTTKIK